MIGHMGEREWRWFCLLLWAVAVTWLLIGFMHLWIAFFYGSWRGIGGEY